MSRGVHRAPSRLSVGLDRWFAQPYIVQFVLAGIVVVIAAGLIQACVDARHTQPAEPPAPAISAPPSPMPRVVGR